MKYCVFFYLYQCIEYERIVSIKYFSHVYSRINKKIMACSVILQNKYKGSYVKYAILH